MTTEVPLEFPARIIMVPSSFLNFFDLRPDLFRSSFQNQHVAILTRFSIYASEQCHYPHQTLGIWSSPIYHTSVQFDRCLILV